MCDRGTGKGEGLEQAKREYLDRERWKLFCHGHIPLREALGGSKMLEPIDR